MKFLTLVEIEIKKILPWLATLFISLTALINTPILSIN